MQYKIFELMGFFCMLWWGVPALRWNDEVGIPALCWNDKGVWNEG
jgi:hypothetical protein